MAMMTKKIDPCYLKLVKQFPLAPIRSRSQLNDALVQIDALSAIDEDRLTPGEADYLFVLSGLVEAYENAHFPLAPAFSDGVDALAYLIDQSNMSASDLGRLLGNRQLGSALLRRERELSKAHIVKLADHFRVSTDLFLAPGKGARRAS